MGLGTCRLRVCLWSFSWTLVPTSPHFFCQHSATARLGRHCQAGRGPPWVEPQQEQKARPPHRTFPGWMELAGAGQGPAQGQETLTSRKVPFC